MWRTSPRHQVLGLDAHADLHRGAEDRVDRGLAGEDLADLRRLVELHRVDRRGDDAPPRVARRGDAGGLVARLEDLAAEHAPPKGSRADGSMRRTTTVAQSRCSGRSAAAGRSSERSARGPRRGRRSGRRSSRRRAGPPRVEDAERRRSSKRAADLLGVPAVDRRADGLERRPVGEVGPEVRHLGVRPRPRRACCAPRSGPGRARPRGARSAPAGRGATRSYSHMSPAAKTPGRRRLQRRRAARRRRARRASRPDERASMTSGTAPTPMTTAWQSTDAARRADEALDVLAVALERARPARRRAPRRRAPRAAPRAQRADRGAELQRHRRLLGEDAASHATPSVVSDAATSQAMNDPPTSATRVGALDVGAQRVGVAQRAQVVDRPRGRCPSIGSRRTFAPVASSALPNATVSFVDSVASRASGSSFITDVRVSTSTSSPTGSETRPPSPTRRAGSPWRSAGARTAGRARGRRAAPSRRSPARAAPRRRPPTRRRRRRAGRRPSGRPPR